MLYDKPYSSFRVATRAGKRQVIGLRAFYPFRTVYKIVVNIRASRTSM
jgi:hypothetical protein